jgi:hypothetical protein
LRQTLTLPEHGLRRGDPGAVVEIKDGEMIALRDLKRHS